METVRLRQDVGLIFIVTEELKTRLLEEFKAAAEEVQQQIDQFDFRARHALAELQRADLNRAMAARQQIDAEKRRLEAVKIEMSERRKEIEELKIGEEYPRGALEGIVDIKVGDNLFEKLGGVQVIVKDGAVVEIRQRTMDPQDVFIPQPRIVQPGQ
ncbi:MAG TPA: YlqD family protein [Armatimonadota bacterium]